MEKIKYLQEKNVRYVNASEADEEIQSLQIMHVTLGSIYVSYNTISGRQ